MGGLRAAAATAACAHRALAGATALLLTVVVAHESPAPAPAPAAATLPLLQLAECGGDAGEWQPSFPRDDLDAWALVRSGSSGGELLCVTAAFADNEWPIEGVDGAGLVLAPCGPDVRTLSRTQAAGLPSYRGWANQSFYATSCRSYNGAGRMVLAYASDGPINYCVGAIEGQSYGLQPCSDVTGQDFTTTVMDTWGLRSPGACDNSASSSNVSAPSVLRDDTIGGDACVGVGTTAAAATAAAAAADQPAAGSDPAAATTEEPPLALASANSAERGRGSAWACAAVSVGAAALAGVW